MSRKSNPKNNGYALVELLFYISSLVIVNALVVMTRSFRETNVLADLQNGSNIIERISREVRKAESISTISASDLKINTTDDAGASKTIEFLLSGSNVQILENNTLTGNLNSPSLSVTGLSFTQISTTSGVAIKMLLTVRSNKDTLGRTVDFYDTISLRGSYAD
jgi:hypothetical protein